MPVYLFFILLLFASVIFGACARELPPAPEKAAAPVAAPSKPEARAGWEQQWEKVLSSAKKEGKVSIYGSTGAAAAKEDIIRNIKEKYGLEVDMIIARGAELNAKLASERTAGLYIPDVYIGGITTIITRLIPAGFFDPLEPALILPEVKDSSKWISGKLPFIDSGKYSLRLSSYARGIVAINTSLARPEEIRSFKDLLNPRWKGKIALNDPTITGAGGDFFYYGTRLMGLDYMREFVKQEPMVTRDQRLLAEWLARGRYAIIVAPLEDTVKEMKKAGAPVEFITYLAEGGWMQAGGGHLTLMNKAPRPNAARVLINWLLSREGATSWSIAHGEPSMRIDVPLQHIDSIFILDPAKKYIEEDEKAVIEKRKSLEIAIDIFGPLIK